MPTTSFTFEDGQQKFNVPNGITLFDVVLKGAGVEGRAGGKVAGKLRIGDDVNALWVTVGKQGFSNSGANGGSGCYGGGGPGGNGHGGANGGAGGAGCAAIRAGTTDGPLKAVAGGAGGTAGGGGLGGQGGGDSGQGGQHTGGGSSGDPTGGTQTQSGKGGNSQYGAGYDGANGENSHLGRGGAGGSATSGTTNIGGGGGGGGGYYPGGGGQAGKTSDSTAAGGGGGSNYTSNMYSVTSTRGDGNTGNATVTISWDTGTGDTSIPPTGITIDNKAITPGLVTKSTGTVTVRGKPHDPQSTADVRMLIRYSANDNFSNHKTAKGTYDPENDADKCIITDLLQDTRYYLRIHTQNASGSISDDYKATNFWTNRSPTEPNLLTPQDNAQFSNLDNVTFTWSHRDPDGNGDGPTAFMFRYRKAATPLTDAGEWKGEHTGITTTSTYTVAAPVFSGNTFYEWEIKTRDDQFKWGVWSIPNSFYAVAEATPPILVEPIGNQGVPVGDLQTYTFRWRFQGRQDNVHQDRADIRFRIAGQSEAFWVTTFGVVDPGVPGTSRHWLIDLMDFTNLRHEWQMRSYDSLGNTSDWSESAYFWGVSPPGSGAGLILIDSGRPQAPLGQGTNRVFVFDRGGTKLRGEITPLANVNWNRKRDDISSCTFKVSQWNDEAKLFLGSLRPWLHEIVVFRTNNDGKSERVWEGPITRITATRDSFEVEAKDVMAYVYRRIMRQGYTDAYQVLNGDQIGLHTVVERSAQIILNALAYDDPNVLAYLTPLHYSGDARTSRVRKDYSRTAWEEVDDLAATAGLDYTTSGRRIVLWDTHRPIGRLPEMRDGDFSEPPVVSIYGMSQANYFAVTNGSGIWGDAHRGLDAQGRPGPEGFLEQLASAYGEKAGAASDRTLTKSAKRELVKSLNSQADRNIAGRYPVPIVARVPDNANISPDVNLGINQIIPGVWIPLRAEGGVIQVSQWQKLDSMNVTQDSAGEKIAVVMSPAPNQGNDPDADLAAAEGDDS